MVELIPNKELDGDTIIWRYMTFGTFYYMLTQSSIFFKRLDKHNDQLEGMLDEATKDKLFLHRLSFPYTSREEAIKWLNKEDENIKSYRSYTLSNSWTISVEENYAMWKIYLAGSTEGVAICTTINKLMSSLESCEEHIKLGKVNYSGLDHDNINQQTVSTYKHFPYSYESEMRALIFNKFKIENEKRVPLYDLGLNVDVDLNKLIEKIWVSPFAGTWFKDAVFNALEIHLPEFDRGLFLYQSNIREQ